MSDTLKSLALTHGVTVAQAQAIASAAIAAQKYVVDAPYYSRIRLAAAVSNPSPGVWNYVWAIAKRYAFSYGIGELMDSAGHVGHTANESDTNINTKAKTNSGEKVRISGISLLPTPDTDPLLFALLCPKISVVLAMNSGDRTILGRPEFMAGSGGFYNAGSTRLFQQPIGSAAPATISFANNGMPSGMNYLPLKQPIIWNPAGDADSNLQVEITQNEAQGYQAVAQAAIVIPVPVTPPVNLTVPGYDPPVAGEYGTFLDFVVRLHCSQASRRSQQR